MKVNFDAMRINATHSMDKLREAINEVIDNKDEFEYSPDLQEQLIEKFNDSAQAVSNFNCLEDEGGDYSALDIDIGRIEEMEE